MKRKTSCRPLLLIIMGLAPLLLSSCAQLLIKNKSYLNTQSINLNGAEVRSAVKPMGGQAGLSISALYVNLMTGTMDGPFLWRIEAQGQSGIHEKLTVHRLKTTTLKTKRSEWFPQKRLGITSEFKPMKGKEGKAGKTFAQVQIPGQLEVYPEKDGEIHIEADISVTAQGKSKRKFVRFRLTPEIKRKGETIFLPVEIVKAFQKDPTEWQW